jgi:probable rRNA maturation factor
VAVALVSDRAMRRLNRAYRHVDRPTDVLSFPADAGEGARPRPAPLGDIAISLDRADRQARVFGHGLATEVRVLALQGLLHLLGYDHDVDDGRMARTEERLRRRAGLPPGLVARAGRSPGPPLR